VGFYIGTDVDEFRVRPWFVNSYGSSNADDWVSFSSNGHFLGVREKKLDYIGIASALKDPGFDHELLGKKIDSHGARVLTKVLGAYISKQGKQ